MRILGWILVAVAALTLLVAAGRRPPARLPDARAIARTIPDDPRGVQAWLTAHEGAEPRILPGTEATIRWHAGAEGERAPVVLLVLHGFSASRQETAPLHDLLADDLGAHVLYTRLHGHGLSDGDLASGTAAHWLTDAEAAYQAARRLGDRVVISGTSTGATLALWLAAQHDNDPELAGVIMVSPNLALRNPLGELVAWPWLAPLIRTAVPSRCVEHDTDEQRTYWTACYSTAAVVHLVDLLEVTRRRDPSQIDVPLRAVMNPDDPALDTAFATAWLSAAPDSQLVPYTPGPGDGDHVLAGRMKSPGGTEPIRRILLGFLADMVDVSPPG